MPPETAPETTTEAPSEAPAEAGQPPAGGVCAELVAMLSILATFGIGLAIVTGL